MNLSIVAVLVVLLAVSSHAAKPIQLGSLCLNQVNCFVNPCQFSKCDAHPRANCVANYCGGCNALWYLNSKRVDCSSGLESKREVVSVPKKCTQVFCFVDPCAFARCENHPEAVCRSNYCGGCNAEFYAAGKRVVCH